MKTLIAIALLLCITSTTAFGYEVTKKIWIHQGTPTPEELSITTRAGVTPFSDEFYWGDTEGRGYRRINAPGVVIQNSVKMNGWKYYEIWDLYNKPIKREVPK